MPRLVAGWFALDAVGWAIRRASPSQGDRCRENAAFFCVGSALWQWMPLRPLARDGLTWVVTIAGALRIFGIAWSIGTAPIHTDSDADDTMSSAELGLSDEPEAVAMTAEISAAEERIARRAIAAGRSPSLPRCFAIHIGRMSTRLDIPRPHVARRRRPWRHAHRRDLPDCS